MELNPAATEERFRCMGSRRGVRGHRHLRCRDGGRLQCATLMTAVFGGSGINLVTLSGDGPVLLQATLHQEFEDDERSSESGPGSGREGLLSKLQ